MEASVTCSGSEQPLTPACCRIWVIRLGSIVCVLPLLQLLLGGTDSRCLIFQQMCSFINFRLITLSVKCTRFKSTVWAAARGRLGWLLRTQTQTRGACLPAHRNRDEIVAIRPFFSSPFLRFCKFVLFDFLDGLACWFR